MTGKTLTLVAMVSAAGLVAAVIGAITEVRGRTFDPLRPQSAVAVRLRRARAELPQAWRERYRWMVAAAAGCFVGVWAFTGWPVDGLIAAGAVLGLPYVLTPGGSAMARIERLEALAQWLRHLAAIHTAGVALTQTVEASAKGSPPAIAAEVRSLAGRLAAGQDPLAAFGAFATEMGDGVVDHIVLLFQSHAILRGQGLAAALTSLADSVAQQAADARAIDADRAKVRSSARMVSLVIWGVVLVSMLNKAWMAPYHTVVGQVVLLILGALFLGAFAALRRIVRGRPEPRLLGPLAKGIRS